MTQMKTGFEYSVLLIVTLIWGTTFSVTKSSLALVPPLYFLAWRFSLAALGLLILNIKRLTGITKDEYIGGVVSGISMAGGDAETIYVSPERLAAKAVELSRRTPGNLGVAFTYNEPLVGFEYVRDCAGLVHAAGLKNILVTNGTVCEKPLSKLLPLIDAMNIDLKGFRQDYYDWLLGDLETVKKTIAISARACHVEVTTLIVPGRNDSEEDMDAEAAWLASLDPAIPLHISRFFPRYHTRDLEPTPVDTIKRLCSVARGRLKYVYSGNC